MTAIIFPGQGSQFTNMAMDFNENFNFSNRIFEEIEDCTNINIRNLISNLNQDKLNQTNFTQIAIFSASIVIYKTLINEIGLETINPKIVLGHSLGEYSALVANKALSLPDASNLIKIRGELMNSSIKPNISGMAAIIGKDDESVNKIIKDHNLNINVANDNSPFQVVVSGLIKDLKIAEKTFIAQGVKKYILLNVSAAFHSKYMLEAQNKLSLEIKKTNFVSSKVPIISNYNAALNSNSNDIVDALLKQMANKVNWTKSVKRLEDLNENKIIEIGPGKVLSGLIKRISNKFDIVSINKIEDLNKLEINKL